MALISCTVTITTIGADAGPFTVDDGLGNTYTNVSRASLLAGYVNSFDTMASQITVTSTGVCTNNLVIPFTPPPVLVPINLEQFTNGIFYTSCAPDPDGWVSDVYITVNGNIELTDAGTKTVFVTEGSSVSVDVWVDDGFYNYDPGAAYYDCGKSVAAFMTASVSGVETLIDGAPITQGPTKGSATPFNAAANYSFIADSTQTYYFGGYAKEVTVPSGDSVAVRLGTTTNICGAPTRIRKIAGGAIATAAILYLADGTTPVTGYNYVCDTSGVIFEIDPVTGQIGITTGDVC